MAMTESPKQAALRRIADQQARIARQRTLIAALKANGSSTQSAMESLGYMQGTLSMLRDSLHLLRQPAGARTAAAADRSAQTRAVIG